VIRTLLRHLLVDFLILVALLTASAILPFASYWLIRDPVGGQIFFWASPWTCAVWTPLMAVLVGSRFWLGREHVLAWRAARGGYLASSLRATGWMFFGLIMSYGLELGVVFLLSPSPTALHLLPLAAYAPVAVAILWSAARG
jgi:hypothetical protein